MPATIVTPLYTSVAVFPGDLFPGNRETVFIFPGKPGNRLGIPLHSGPEAGSGVNF